MSLPWHGFPKFAVPGWCCCHSMGHLWLQSLRGVSLLAGVTYGCSPSGAYFWYEATPAQSVSPAAFPALCLPLLTDDSVFLKPVWAEVLWALQLLGVLGSSGLLVLVLELSVTGSGLPPFQDTGVAPCYWNPAIGAQHAGIVQIFPILY